jgi:nucleoside-diphosphate-sugar epimerase
MHDAYSFPVTIIFPFNSYGRPECKHFITEKIIWQMLTQETVKLGDPEPVRDLMFITDHIDGYIAALGRGNAVGETFNICTGKGVTIKELTEKIAALTGFKGELVWGTIPSRPLDIQRLVGNYSKAANMLGWSPKVSLDEGLEQTVKQMKGEM